MSLDQIFKAENTLCKLNVSSQKQLFLEMAQTLELSGALKDTGQSPSDIVNAALERERLGSTGVGTGVAIPHARLAGLTRVKGVFATLETPLEYDSVDDRPVDIVAMLVAPEDAGSEHLRALANISRRLRREDVRARLRDAPNALSLFICLTDGTSANAA